MNKFRIGLSLLIAAAAAVFAARHPALRQLRSEREQLQAQAAEVVDVQVASAPVPSSAADATNAVLTAGERSELLRLRSQAGILRQELARAGKQTVVESHPPEAEAGAAPEEPMVTRQEQIQKVTRGRDVMLAVLVRLREIGRELPATLADALPADRRIEGADDFELVQGGLDLNSIPSPAHTIVLREKQPWRGGGNRWHRVYAFADGHAEFASSITRDFTAWEEKFKATESQAP
jgi:hypothetical protein